MYHGEGESVLKLIYIVSYTFIVGGKLTIRLKTRSQNRAI